MFRNFHINHVIVITHIIAVFNQETEIRSFYAPFVFWMEELAFESISTYASYFQHYLQSDARSLRARGLRSVWVQLKQTSVTEQLVISLSFRFSKISKIFYFSFLFIFD